MRATTFHEYVQQVSAIVSQAVANDHAVLLNLQIDQRSTLRGRIEGQLQYVNGSELHFKEFVDLTLDDPKAAYAYHYQDADNGLIFRYDNATHRPTVGAPHHKHTATGTEPSTSPDLLQIVDEISRGARS